MSTIFGKILQGDIPAEKVYEDEQLIAIKDINPVAPIHLLIIPRKEFASLQAIPDAELSIVSHIAKVAQKLAKEFDIVDNYRLLTNNGSDAGQTIFHLHFHLIGGKKLGPMA